MNRETHIIQRQKPEIQPPASLRLVAENVAGNRASSLGRSGLNEFRIGSEKRSSQEGIVGGAGTVFLRWRIGCRGNVEKREIGGGSAGYEPIRVNWLRRRFTAVRIEHFGNVGFEG